MGTFSVLLALCAGNSPVTGDFPTRRPVTRNFDVFFDLHMNKRLSKQSWVWWSDTISRLLWRYCNVCLLWHLLYGFQYHPEFDYTPQQSVMRVEILRSVPHGYILCPVCDESLTIWINRPSFTVSMEDRLMCCLYLNVNADWIVYKHNSCIHSASCCVVYSFLRFMNS